MPQIQHAASIIVPAHNEGSRIGLLLQELVDGQSPAERRQIIVVCNGCTDDTADVARRFPDVQVVEIPEPSKRAALDVGDLHANMPYRVYVDADVIITWAAIAELLSALRPPIHVAAPTRKLDVRGAAAPVRWYYEVWRQLPGVKDGVFGRGVIAMSPEALARARSLPRVMSDDLAISDAFSPQERVIVESAIVTIAVPRTVKDLIRRRIRVVTGNAQLDDLALRADESRTKAADLLRISLAHPANPLKVVVFGVITVVSRLASRRRVRSGDFTTWLRDESSRR
ncbi:glycosyltransferase [Microbacterium sp. Leaf288]|uniref:glycosyltransferase n=1 Tax=Microbacterium sp. Leaf288 TaxID=1736323 RepID=UPI00138F673A|nr:glycosyltransferase [Microbacterium sp. Leaf288]